MRHTFVPSDAGKSDRIHVTGSVPDDRSGQQFTLCEGTAAIVQGSTGDSPDNDGESMTLLQFPADRRMADIRRCAEALQNLHGEAANRFWRSEMVAFAAMLKGQNVAEDDISHQAGLFMHAVQMELQAAYCEDADQVNASA